MQTPLLKQRPQLPGAATAGQSIPIHPSIATSAIVVVKSKAEATMALSALMTSDAIGFDTESKPTFRKGEVSTGPHLIQLSTDEKAYLFQTAYPGNLKLIKQILESAVLKIGFGLEADHLLLKEKLDVTLKNVLDLGEELKQSPKEGPVGIKTAVTRFFGHRFLKSKKISTSNWASKHLTEPQLRYAANDAYIALQVYRAWRNKLN